MNEAEAFIVLPIGLQALADEINRAAKEFRLCRINAHAVAPAPPMGLCLAKARFKIPGVSLKPRRALPLPRVEMHAGRDFAQHLEWS